MAERNEVVRYDETGPGVSAIKRPTTEMAVSRVTQEVQAAMIVAQQFPRDEAAAEQRILAACRRPALAEAAVYSYPRGNTVVTGPSIRLAETIARCWGNLDSGTIELEQRDGESQMMAYAWDLETNTRQTKVWTVPHVRDTRRGTTKLTSSRDIYETTANQAARRLRACILALVPSEIQEAAIAECERTLASASQEPLADRVAKMLRAFDAMGVTKERIEKRLGHAIAAITENEMVLLRKLYQSIHDGMATAEQQFPPDESDDWVRRIADCATTAEARAINDELREALLERTISEAAADRVGSALGHKIRELAYGDPIDDGGPAPEDQAPDTMREPESDRVRRPVIELSDQIDASTSPDELLQIRTNLADPHYDLTPSQIELLDGLIARRLEQIQGS